MIHYFPEPYPDELWYSVVARYKHHTGFRYKITPKHIVKPYKADVRIHLPTNFYTITKNVASHFEFSPSKLIWNHTIFPFVTFHLDIQEKQAIFKTIKNKPSCVQSIKLYTMYRRMIRNPSQAICPICVEQDRKKYGEAYFHRMHTIGLPLCHIHHCQLRTYSNRLSEQKGYYSDYDALERIIPKSVKYPTPRFWKGPNKGKLIQICHDSHWVMQQVRTTFSLNEILLRYKWLLGSLNIASQDQLLSPSAINREFEKFYSRPLLKRLFIRPLPFLTRSLKDDFMKAKGRFTPLQHVLLIQFLGFSVEDFFNLPLNAPMRLN